MTEFVIELFSDYTFQIVAMGSSFLGIVSGALGCFVVLRKQSLLGDGLSHSALPGVVIAFLLTGTRNIEILLLGAAFTGILATLSITGIVKHTRIKFDAALAMTLAVFFGLGMSLLTYSQRIPNANQAGLDTFIYGQTATLLERDVIIISSIGCVLLVLVFIFWKEFKLLSFDPEYMKTIGFSSGKVEILLSAMIVFAIIIGLQTVGAILMSAMLIAPAVAARQWVNKLSAMVILSGIFGGVSSVVGTAISSLGENLSTGPMIVISVSCITLISILFAPNRGVIHKIYQRCINRIRFEKERSVR